LLQVAKKQRREEPSSTEAVELPQKKQKQKPLKILREGVDARTQAKLIEFDDDGQVVPSLMQQPSTVTDVVTSDAATLRKNNDAVVQRLRARLRASEGEARRDEHENLRERKQLKKAKRRKAQEEEQLLRDDDDDDDDRPRFKKKRKSSMARP